LLDSGKRLVFDYERLDSSDPRDRKAIINRAEDAREHSELLSYRVRDTKERQREAGAWLGRPPYGSEIADRLTRKLRHATAEVAPGITAWDVVLRIFTEIAEGRPARQVAIRLNADGIPSSKGEQWGAGVIHRMLSSPVYEGWQAITTG